MVKEGVFSFSLVDACYNGVTGVWASVDSRRAKRVVYIFL